MTAAQAYLQARPENAISEHGCWRAIVPMILAGFIVVAGSDSSWHCPGFEPSAPPGCRGVPRCLCDADGNCRLWFTCDEN
jgi:hypothetical protein